MKWGDDGQLYQTLEELEVIEPKELEETWRQAQQEGRDLGEMLLEKNLISDENLGKTMAEIGGYPLVRLGEVTTTPEIWRKIPEVFAREQLVMVFAKEPDGYKVAMANPREVEIVGAVEKKLGEPIEVFLATKRDLNKSFSWYAKEVKQAFEDIIGENVNEAKKNGNSEPPIIKIVDTILEYAYDSQASDIHIEPDEDATGVRFRIDGILHDIVRLPPELHGQIVTRIKVMSSLRTDEHLAAQDGKLQVEIGEVKIDIRVSIVPITEGEKIVMRLLSDKARQYSLTDLGFSGKDLEKLEEAYNKPYGMILATGPTGSGKTTTMYSVLKLLNRREVNIMTIEDPVEYDLEGVNQIQVNPKTGLTFAKGLRSIVRQDPDVILVGEIRDEETASIAVNSAMTGHLVLSTLHTNDAATAIPRLLDMGIEPFLVASTVNVIVAQRLVRKVHTVCRLSQEVDRAEIESVLDKDLVTKYLGTGEKLRMYKGKGCKIDHETGYEGRVGIYEVMVIDDEIREAIMARQDAAVIKKIAQKNGLISILEDGLDKVRSGVTTLEEVLRVTKE
jgi:type IV pilus assembly protein PilB